MGLRGGLGGGGSGTRDESKGAGTRVMDKAKEYETRHIDKGQGQGKDKGKATIYAQPFLNTIANWQRI